MSILYHAKLIYCSMQTFHKYSVFDIFIALFSLINSEDYPLYGP